MAELKQALTYEQQIERLKQYHNLTIEDEAAAVNILKRVNYYRLSAYGIGLTKPDHKEEYLDGITLNTLYRLYLFDSEFRNQLFHIIEHIEVQLRTQIANLLALQYGSEGYMDENHFMKMTDRKGNSIHKLVIDHFQNEAERQKNLLFVKHHMDKYDGHFPIWVAVELFSFGKLSSLYSILRTKDKKQIAALYSVSPKNLQGWILALVEIRNRCAHYNRIYNLPLKTRPHLDKKYDTYNSSGIVKIFPSLIVIKHMVEPEHPLLWQTFYNNIHSLITEYNQNGEIKLHYMGFPKEWEQVLSVPLSADTQVQKEPAFQT